MRRALLPFVALILLGAIAGWVVRRAGKSDDTTGTRAAALDPQTARRAAPNRGQAADSELVAPDPPNPAEAAVQESAAHQSDEPEPSEARAPRVQDGSPLEAGAPADPVSPPPLGDARLVVRVVDDAQRPVAQATVLLFDKRGSLVSGGPWTTDGAGRCDPLVLPAGSYDAWVGTRDGRAGSSSLRRLSSASPEELTVTLGTGARLWPRFEAAEQQVHATFRVSDARGRALGSLSLATEGAAPYPGRPIGPLPPGRYRVEARISGEPAGERWVTLLEIDRVVVFDGPR